MAKEDDIKEELLKQMDADSTGGSDAKPDLAQRIIETHSAQVRRLKWFAVISWVVTILYFSCMSILRDIYEVDINHFLTQEELFIFYCDIGLKVLLLIAVLLTVVVYLKSRTLTIQQICARLSNIEEQLKKISQDK